MNKMTRARSVSALRDNQVKEADLVKHVFAKTGVVCDHAKLEDALIMPWQAAEPMENWKGVQATQESLTPLAKQTAASLAKRLKKGHSVRRRKRTSKSPARPPPRRSFSPNRELLRVSRGQPGDNGFDIATRGGKDQKARSLSACNSRSSAVGVVTTRRQSRMGQRNHTDALSSGPTQLTRKTRTAHSHHAQPSCTGGECWQIL